MPPPGTPPPVNLDEIGSPAIRWVVDCAIDHGNQVAELAQWSKALVAHMEAELSVEVRDAVQARYPELEFYQNKRSPHYSADEGFIEDGFAVSFPWRDGAG